MLPRAWLLVPFALAFLASGLAAPTQVEVCPSGCPFQSIQAAVEAVAWGATVEVHAGTYHESVTVNTTLTLRGAQAGVPAPGRAGPETVVDAAGRGYAVLVRAPDVTIDGFRLEASAAGPWGIVANEDGLRVRNNDVRGNGFGVYLAASEGYVVEANRFEGGGLAQAAVYASEPTRNLTLRGNEARNQSAGAFYLLTGARHENLRVEANTLVGPHGLRLAHVAGAVVADNRVDGREGIHLANASGLLVVRGNTVRGFDAAGITVRPDEFAPVVSLSVEANDVDGPSQAYGIDVGPGLAAAPRVADNDLRGHQLHIVDRDGRLDAGALIAGNRFDRTVLVQNAQGRGAGRVPGSIAAALAYAVPGAVLVASPGVYPESVEVTVPVVLRGAQAGVAAEGRTGAESVLTGGPDAFVVRLAASGSVLDGFIIEPAESRDNLAGVAIAGVAATVRNSVVRGASVGLLVRDAPGVVVEGNLFDANDGPGPLGGRGVVALGATRVLAVRGNDFIGHPAAAVELGAAPGRPAHDRAVLADNRVSGGGLLVDAAVGALVARNIVEASDVGLRLGPAARGTVVADNTFRENTVGVYLAPGSEAGRIRGNLLEANNRAGGGAGTGLLVEVGSAATVIEGNIFRGHQAAGLAVRETMGTVVQENQLVGGGIVLVNATGAMVRGNFVADTRGVAIAATGNLAGSSVDGNTLRRNGVGIAVSGRGPLQLERNDIAGDNASVPGSIHGVLLRGSEDVTIRGNLATGHSDAGIAVEASRGVVVEDNTLTRDSLHLRASSMVRVAGNAVRDALGPALLLSGGNDGVEVSANSFARGASDGIRIARGDGLLPLPGSPDPGPNANVTLQRNRFEANAAAGVRLNLMALAGPLAASPNWWGAATGPVLDPTAALPWTPPLGQSLAGDPVALATASWHPWCEDAECATLSPLGAPGGARS